MSLPTGFLTYRGQATTHDGLALTDLCGFGARQNPKRGFVFVSKVLGKHWPSRPSAMLKAHRELAARIPLADDAPLLFVGMAETATGLGHAVFEAFLARETGHQALFLQTTRYPLSEAERVDFQEEHSHATQQFLYLPEDPAHRDLLARATTAVLVDDEATSGKTFVNLAAALKDACPALERVVPLVLTDFTQGALAPQLAALPGVTGAHPVSLWQGSYEFARDPDFALAPAPVAHGAVGCRRAHISAFTARLGLDRAIALAPGLVARCLALVDRPVAWVVGTGECMHPAFRLALELERRGLDTRVQSTTRSPLLVGSAIADVVRVTDPYGEDVPNYLYNASRSRGARCVLVHESGERACVDALVAELDAIEVDLRLGRVVAPARAEG